MEPVIEPVISVKDELDIQLNNDKNDVELETLKTENVNPKQDITETSNPFENVHLQVEKDQYPIPVSTDINNPFENVQLQVKEEITFSMIIEKEPDSPVLEPMTPEIIEPQIKTEVHMDESLVSYDYPVFDDGGSMDSNEISSLENVESCLQEEINIKSENEANYEDCQKEELANSEVKQETLFTVTDTQLTPNNLYTDGVLKGPSTNIMTKIEGNLEEMTYLNTEPESYMDESSFKTKEDKDFQLNSITGNCKTLQEEINEKDLIKCEECTNTYKCKVSMRRHYLIHRDIERRAASFARGLEKRKEMYKHRREMREKQANECFQLNSITGDMLTLEQQVYAMLNSKSKNGQFICTICKEVAISKRELKKHVYTHKSAPNETIVKEKTEEINGTNKESYKCTCGKEFHRRSRMETCLRSHDFSEINASVTCLTCSRKFRTKQELTSHRKRLHRKKFPCKFCPTDYNTRKELFKHLQIHQKVQLMEYKVITEVMKGKEKLQCFMCQKSYSALSELKIHVMNEHKGPYICPHCKNMFPKIIDFGNHTKIYHPDVAGQSVLNVLEAFSRLIQAWKCPECDEQFLEADKLALHQMEKHNPDVKSEAQFQCTDCRRVFISQKGLTSHRRIHHSSETVENAPQVEPGIMCLECRKICKDMTALTSHMRLHSPDRKYPCKFCDFRFATPEKRKAHAELHTGDMKFVCFICEYTCSSENRLKHHKSSLKHVNMKEYLLTGKPLIEETTSETPKGKARKRKKMENGKTEKKESSSSGEESEVECDICGEKFCSEMLMLEHKQTHPFIEFPNDDKPSRIFFK